MPASFCGSNAAGFECFHEKQNPCLGGGGQSRYREVIALALKQEPDIQLAGEFGTAEIALRSLKDRFGGELPDLMLLDLHLPGMDGLEALPEFLSAAPVAKIMILTQSDNEADVLRAISLGASGYLLKSSTVSTITDGIRSVMKGGASLDAGVARFILNTLKARLSKSSSDGLLTERQRKSSPCWAKDC